MKEFRYAPSELELFRFIQGKKFSRLIIDAVFLVIDFDSFYIEGYAVAEAANAQHPFGEALRMRFDKDASPYDKRKGDKEILEEGTIKKIWILRTCLYFSDYKRYRSEEEAIEGLPEAENDTGKTLIELAGLSSGGFNEFIVNPTSNQAQIINKDYANLVEAGILIELEDRFIACHPMTNSSFIECKILNQAEILFTVLPFYELVELNNPS